MDSARESILELMNEYCYRIDRGDLQGFADLFSEGTWLVILVRLPLWRP